jgi:hypothetical protein
LKYREGGFPYSELSAIYLLGQDPHGRKNMTSLLSPLLAATLGVSAVSYGLSHAAAATTDQLPRHFAQAGSPALTSPPEVVIPSERDARMTLEHAGYSNIRNVKSGPEGVTAVATKDGQEMALVVDSSGKILQRKAP